MSKIAVPVIASIFAVFILQNIEAASITINPNTGPGGIDVIIESTNYPADEDNIKIIFNPAGDNIGLPILSSNILIGLPGTEPNSVKATGTGIWKVKVTIPLGKPAGNYPIMADGPVTDAGAIYLMQESIGSVSGTISYSGNVYGGDLHIKVMDSSDATATELASRILYNINSQSVPYSVGAIPSGSPRFVLVKYIRSGTIIATGSSGAFLVTAGSNTPNINISLGGVPMSLNLVPNTGVPGSQVNAHIQGFIPNSTISQVLWVWTGGSATLPTNPAAITTDPNGIAGFSFNVPANAQAGSICMVKVLGADSTQFVSMPFTVSSTTPDGNTNVPVSGVIISNIVVNAFLAVNPNNLANQPGQQPFRVDIHAPSVGYVEIKMQLSDASGKRYFIGKSNKIPVYQPGPVILTPGSGFFSEVWSDTTVTQLPTGIYTFNVKVISDPTGIKERSLSIPITSTDQPPSTVPPSFLINPVNTSVPTQLPNFVWSPVAGANKYMIFVGLDPNPEVNPLFKGESEHPMTQLVYPAGIKPLRPGAKYYWRVRSFQLDSTNNLKPIGGIDGRSQVAHFTVGMPGQTKITAIGPMGKIEKASPVFMWAPVANASNYLVMLSDTPDMGHIIWKFITPATNIIYTPDAPPLKDKKNYFWQIIGLDENSRPIGQDSSSGTFNTGANQNFAVKSDIMNFNIKSVEERVSQGKLVLVSPDNMTLPNSSPIFIWVPVPEINSYEITISDNPGFSPVLYRSKIERSSNFIYPPDAPSLSADKQYFWKIAALDSSGKAAGEPSKTANFKVSSSGTSTTGNTNIADMKFLSPQEIESVLKSKIKDKKILEAVKDYILLSIMLDPPEAPGEMEKIIDALMKGEAEIIDVKVKE